MDYSSKILKIKIPNVCDFLAAKYTVSTSVFEVRER
jgi:hypothetical protein